MANSDLTVPCIIQDNNLPIPADSVTHPTLTHARPLRFLQPFSLVSPRRRRSCHGPSLSYHSPACSAKLYGSSIDAPNNTLSGGHKQPLHARSSAVTAAA